MAKSSEESAGSSSTNGSNDGFDGYRVVQRTIMRASQELDVRALYMGTVTSMGSGGDASSGQSGSDRRTDDSGGSKDAPQADSGIIGYGRVNEDDSTVADPGRRITFGTYFNAFPASYWRRWSDHRSVRLEARIRGEGTLIVYRSTARGHVLRANSVPVNSDTTTTVSLDLTLNPFIDGGWYWFDLEAGDVELVLESAEWMIETDRLESGRVTLGITTFNRPDFCADQLVALSQDPSTLEILDEVIVVDQGNQKVVETEKYTQRQGGARRPGADHRPAQPRRLRRFLARDVRGPAGRVPPTTSCCSTTMSSASSRASSARSPSPTWPSGPRWSVVTCSASTTAR